MNLQYSENELFTLEVTALELETLQSGLRETLEALGEAEFQTRTGVEREQMRELARSLVAQRRALRNIE